MNNEVAKTQRKSLPLAIKGTWDSAREWHGAAGTFERCKLYCQVMLGFELLALHKAAGVKPGNPQFRQVGGIDTVADSAMAWSERVEREIGVSETSARRFMEMAKAASSRLKNLPLLQGFDPTITPIKMLSEGQKSELQTGVRKLTDNQTQQEFGEQLGLWKLAIGAGGGNLKADGKKALSAAEKIAALQQEANDRLKNACAELVAIGPNWAGLPDEDLEIFDHYFDTWLKAKREWVKTPQEKRDVAALAEKMKKAYR